MKLHMSYKSIPELSGLPKEERKRLWDKYYKKALLNWKAWIALLFFILFQIGAGELKFILKNGFPEIHWRFIYHPITLFSWLIGFSVLFHIIGTIARSYMLIDIQKHGANWTQK